MKRPFVLAAVLLFVAFAGEAQRRGAVDWIFLVDTSKSMRANGIFSSVQASIDTFVQQANDGDTVTIFTFDRDVVMRSTTPIGVKTRADLGTIVNGLEANGNRTHLGLAIRKGLERASDAGSDKTRVSAVVLFTDGKEDVRGIADPVPISSNVKRVGDSYVFFVSMGNEHETQLDDFAKAASHSTVMRAPSAKDVREVADEIRAQLPDIPTPIPPPKPRNRATPQPEQHNLRWLIALPILAAIAFVAFTLHRRSNNLEGELEILQPRVASDSSFIGLPRLAANQIALSSILPVDILGGNDARLFVRRRDGNKTVWISAPSGSPLRVNDTETPESELFDADTIQIGDARLRFNRVGYERPQEDL